MHILATAILGVMIPVVAHGAVLCAKPSRTGTFNGTVKIREACKSNEVQLSPDALGFCCSTSTTTTTSTTASTCPPYTTSTNPSPYCGEFATCGGLCANARGCVDGAGGGCECTGAELPCGPVSKSGMCGGTCPSGSTCKQTFHAEPPPGCPGSPKGCACLP